MTKLTGNAPNPNKVDLNVGVAITGATTPEMRGKAGKVGRVIAILRLLPLKTVKEIAWFIEQEGGMEALLANHKRPPPLSDTELLVTCTPEQLDDVLSRADARAILEIRLGRRAGGGRLPVELVSVSEVDEVADPFPPQCG